MNEEFTGRLSINIEIDLEYSNVDELAVSITELVQDRLNISSDVADSVIRVEKYKK